MAGIIINPLSPPLQLITKVSTSVPAPLVYGGAGTPGGTGLASDANHVHPLSYPPNLGLGGMVFTEIYKRAWFDGATQFYRLMPPSLQWVNDPFDDPAMGRFTNLTSDNLGVFAIAGGQATIMHTAGLAHSNHIYEGASIAPAPQVMTSIDIVSRAGAAPAGSEQFRLGILLGVNDYVEARIDVVANTCSIQVKIGGASTFLGSVGIAWATPYTIALSIVGNSACVYRYAAGTWTYITGADLTTAAPPLDLKAAVLANWYGCFGLVSDASVTKTWTIDNFQIGRFGGTAARDWCVITNEDGSAQIAGSVVRTLATLVDPRGVGCMGLFTADLKKKTFVQSSLIFVNDGAGRIQNYLAGHMILYPSGDQLLSVSTWNSGAPIRIVQKLELFATQDLTTGTKVIAGMATLALTVLPAGGSQWDPFMIKQAGTWYMAYTASPVAPNMFFPCLDSSLNLIAWANVGSDTSATSYEGTRILPIAGASYVVAGGPFDMRYYDLAMVYQGLINVISPGNGTTKPHAMIFPDPLVRLYWLLTFDEQTWPLASGVQFAWGWIRLFASSLN